MAQLRGGGEKNIDPGFKAFKDEIGPNVLVYEPSPGKMTELFQSGQAVIAVWGSGRAKALADTGFPADFIYPKEGGDRARHRGLPGRRGQESAARRTRSCIPAHARDAGRARQGRRLGPANMTVELEPRTAGAALRRRRQEADHASTGTSSTQRARSGTSAGRARSSAERDHATIIGAAKALRCSMAFLVLERLTKRYGDQSPSTAVAGGREGRVRLAARPVRLRQDDDAADDRRLRRADRRARSCSTAAI